MTKQQYFVAALCILFMAGLQFAGYKWKEKTGKNNPLWQDDEDEDEGREKTAEKVPDEIEDSEMDLEQQKRLAAAWTETKVREEVRIAVIERPQRYGRRIRILKSLGWRVDAPVLEILGDPQLKAKLTTPVNMQYFGKVVPLTVAIDLMEHSQEKLVDPLLPFATHSNTDVESAVAEVLAQYPSPKTMSHLKSALTEGNKYVQHAATEGLGKAKHIDAASQAELYPIVQRLTNDGKIDSAAEALLALDEKRALEFFESEAFIRVESPGLTYALYALAERKKNLPREKLLKLIQVQRGSVLNGELGLQMSRALILLGHHRHAEDKALFETLMNSPQTAMHTPDGYLAYHGLDQIDDLLDKARENKEWVGLNRQKKLYMALQEFDWAMDEGGLQEYLGSDSGDHWQEALAGLKAVALYEHEARLRAELDKLSKSGVSNVPAQRRKQLDVLMKKNPRAFDKFDEFYVNDSQPLYAQMAKFAVKNKESFK